MKTKKKEEGSSGCFRNRQAVCFWLPEPEDLLVDQERCLILENGTTKLSGITGTGCMVGALTAAYLAQKDPFTAAVLGTSVMGIAGELAERSSKGPGSFQIELLDAVAGMRQEVLEAKLRIRETEA